MKKSLLVICLLLYNLMVAKNTNPPLVITIYNTTHTINDDKNCSIDQWNNKIKDACECCLLQQHSISAGKIPIG